MPSPETIDRLEAELSAAHTEAEHFLFEVPAGELDLPPDLTPKLARFPRFSIRRLYVCHPWWVSLRCWGALTRTRFKALFEPLTLLCVFAGYYEWKTEVLHDEGTVLGLRPAGSSEDQRISPAAARTEIGNALDQVSRRIGILRAQAEAVESGHAAPAQQALGAAAVSIQPGTAFIIMAIDSRKPELEDVKRAIQQECARFNIRAIRADDIEHSGEITHRIVETIRTSEFLIADLTGERPSVYYEVGFAHAIGKRPILYRKARSLSE